MYSLLHYRLPCFSFLAFYGPEQPKWSPVPLLRFLGVLKRIGELVAECGGNGNILSVDSALRFSFDKFYWWLEEVPGKVRLLPIFGMWATD